jgi:hypothetical protein
LVLVHAPKITGLTSISRGRERVTAVTTFCKDWVDGGHEAVEMVSNVANCTIQRR